MVEMRFVTARACVGVRVCSPWREVPLTQEPAKDQQERETVVVSGQLHSSAPPALSSG